MRRAEVPPPSGRRPALGLSLLLALSVLAPGTTASESTALAHTVHRPARPVQPTASVTAVEPATLPQADQRETMTPAIHLGTAGTGRPTTEVRVSAVLLRAYRAAVDGAPRACHLPVSLLAAIGQVESGSLVGRPLDDEHRTSILGPELDGMDFAAVADTDHGRWDGDTTWDRAVGPMQFLPGTWLQYGVDGDGDGRFVG